MFFIMNSPKISRKIPFLLVCITLFMPALTADAAAIIAFGDSITEGYGSNSGGYPPKLETLLAQNCKPSTILNAGVGGEQTPQGIARFDSLLSSFPADFILIMEGSNDVNSGISIETTRFNLKAMIDRCKTIGVTPLLATLTPNSQSNWEILISQSWNPMIRALAKSQGVRLVDQYNAVMPTWLTSNVDGIHPNDLGYQIIAKAWYKVIASDDLCDAIAILQIFVGQMPNYQNHLISDINQDNKIGIAEIICRLKSTAE